MSDLRHRMPTRFKIPREKDRSFTREPAARLELGQSGFEPHPDFGQMVVVMLGHEIKMVHETKRLLQPRVQ